MKLKLRVCSLLLALSMLTSIMGGAIAEGGTEPTFQEVTSSPESPTAEPTAEPTPKPTEKPTEEPTPKPTAKPTAEPTDEPKQEPAADPTQAPSAEPDQDPASTPETAAEPIDGAPDATDIAEATDAVEATNAAEATDAMDASDQPTLDPAAEATPSPFVAGLVLLTSGTEVYSDRDLDKLWGTLQADGVAYAVVEEGDQLAKVVLTLDGAVQSEGYISYSSMTPLTEEEIVTYLEPKGTEEQPVPSIIYENYPLYALSIALEEVAVESTPAPFVEGLVKIPVGTAIFADEKMAQPVGTTLAEGVVYLSPLAEAQPLSMVYAADTKATANGCVDAKVVYVPLTEAEQTAYLAKAKGPLYQTFPLMPLKLEPAKSYEMATYGFLGMPEGYVLSTEELADKASLSGTLEQLQTMVVGTDYVKDEVLLTAQTREYADLVAASYNAEVARYNYTTAVLKINRATTVLQMVTAAADPLARLIAVEPNYYQHFDPDVAQASTKVPPSAFMELESTPAQTMWSDYKDGDLYLRDPGNFGSYQYMHDVVNSFGAWGLTQGKPSVRIAMIDSGVLASHPDLSPRVLAIPAGPGNPYTGGSDYANHGTHVAGIIAASQGNAIGGAGIAPKVTICSYATSLTDSDVIYALDVLRMMPAPDNIWAINMSLGGAAYSAAYEAAVERCIDAGIPIIAAIGNDGGGTNYYPANFPRVISVAATDATNMRATFSCFGSATLAAPGANILSTLRTGSYGNKSGTSMATPVVSGVVALYYSAVGKRDLNGDGAEDAADVAYLTSVLKSSCEMPSVSGGGLGAGIVNANNMFKKMVTKPTFTITYRGNTYKAASGYVPTSAVLHVASGYNGQSIVYTINGTNPTISSGKVTNGTKAIVDFEGNWTLDIPFTGFTAGARTIKAMTINAQGVASAVATFTCNINNSAPTGVAIRGSQFLCQGKSGVYAATIIPVTKTLRCTWTIVSGQTLAMIDAYNGKLTIKPGATGTVTIRASVVGASLVYAEYDVHINPSITKAVALNFPSLALGTDVSSSNTILPTATLMDNTVLTGREGMSYAVSSSNPLIVKVKADDTGWVAVPVAPGSATITFTALDGSAKKAICAVKVKRPVSDVSIVGGAVGFVIRGRYKLLSALITPTNATNRKVVWKLDGNQPQGVTLSSVGMLYVPAGAPADSVFGVTCTSVDNGSIIALQTITVLGAPVSSVMILSTDEKVVRDSRSLIAGAKLFTRDLNTTEYDQFAQPGTYNYETKLQLDYSLNGAPKYDGMMLWRSSNSKIATVDQTGLVVAVSAGSAIITCVTQDGSGKAASVPIKVVIPNSYIKISPSTADYARLNSPLLCYGKSSQLSVNYGNSYGVPTTRAVTWSFKAYYGVSTTTDITDACKASGIVTLSSSGLLAVKQYPEAVAYYVEVKATTTDGTNLSASITYYVQPPVTLFGILDGSVQNDDGSYYNYAGSPTLNVSQSKSLGFYVSDGLTNDFTISSSNPSVAAPFSWVDGGVTRFCKATGDTVFMQGEWCKEYQIMVLAYKPGTTRINVKSNDGSGKTCSFYVTVVP